MDRRRLIPALITLLLVVAPAARADQGRWPAGGSTLKVAMALGAEHWGMTPCGGRVAVRWERLDPGINAQSAWANDVDPYLQPSFNVDCEIALSPAAGWDWVKLCSVVVHEVGHLTGHDHVDDPADVMYYGYVEPVAECAQTPEPVETGPPVSAARPPAKAKAKKAAPAKKAKARARKAPARRRPR